MRAMHDAMRAMFQTLRRVALHTPQRSLLMLVRGYQLLVSPMLRASCRYEPSCSAYASEALTRHGAAAGAYLAACRVLRCHPLCAGGFDPVPSQAPRLFTREGAEPRLHDQLGPAPSNTQSHR